MKKKTTTGGMVSVTFELPAEVEAESVALCGDFNDWDTGATVLKRRKDGSFSATLRLAPGRYRYRYLVDQERWENDWVADDYEPNDHGSDDSVIDLRSDSPAGNSTAETKKAKTAKAPSKKSAKA